MITILAEKPSVAREIARVTGAMRKKKDITPETATM